jgi:hypothetical protein
MRDVLMPISLPQKPDGNQYEDFVTAGLVALGYFTESRLVLRDERKEILELDVVATPTNYTSGTKTLYEAKKDGFKFENLFKLFGQRTYLRLPAACLVSLKPPDPAYATVYETRALEMGVRICHCGIDSDHLKRIGDAQNDLTGIEQHKVCGIAWYQQIAKRLAFAAFFQQCKTHQEEELYQRAKSYVLKVQESFFERTPLARAEALYNAYKETPRLPGEFVAGMALEEGVSQQTIWGRLNDTGQHVWLQYLMLVENTARIGIVKNALEDVLERGETPLPSQKLKFGETTVDWPLHDLPDRFLKGLDLLRKHPHASRLPYLFQVYVELFGGFLAHKHPDEVALLSRLTGIPGGEVVSALRLLDEFFSPGSGSFFYTQKDELLCLKMVPGFVRGGGCFLRRHVFDCDDYGVKYPKMGWLMNRLHMATYKVLEAECGTATVG